MSGSLANQAVGLLVLPVLTRYLSPDEYGSVALFTAFVTFSVTLIGMSFGTHINRNYFKVDKVQIAGISLNCLVGLLLNLGVSLLLLSVLGTGFRGWVERVLGIPVLWAAFGLLVAAALVVNQQFTAFLRIQEKAAFYAGFQVLTASANLGISLALVVVFSLGWQGRALGYAASAFGAATFAFGALHSMQLLRGRPDAQVLREIYRISLPLVPHSVAGQITIMGSRFFLNSLANRGAVGLYAVGHTFGSALYMPVDAFINAWTPWIFKRLAGGTLEDDKKVVRVIGAASAGLLAIWAGVVVLLPAVLRLLTAPAYHGSAGFIAWVAFAYVLQGVYALLLPILVDVGKTGGLAVVSGIVAIASLISNYAFISWFGAIGAAYALTLCSAIRLSGVVWFANRVRPMPWLSALSWRGGGVGDHPPSSRRR